MKYLKCPHKSMCTYIGVVLPLLFRLLLLVGCLGFFSTSMALFPLLRRLLSLTLFPLLRRLLSLTFVPLLRRLLGLTFFPLLSRCLVLFLFLNNCRLLDNFYLNCKSRDHKLLHKYVCQMLVKTMFNSHVAINRMCGFILIVTVHPLSVCL